MMAAIIEARDLVKRFDGFTAVDHISFAVPEGVIFAFLGPNGAGKTTTIKMLTTVLTPSEGRLLITGHDPVTEPLLGGNALLRALRALARIERTLFTLQWLSDPVLRQRSHAGLNKGEASNALRLAVFFHRQREIRDRTFENQSFRASGLSLITAAIVHWNMVYLDRAVRQLRAQGGIVPDDLLAHVAPLGWEHIGLTGDYVWTEPDHDAPFRPLREARATFPALAA
jgi:energy-coupling factor transporter ATP-binding protein EcfA2